MDATPRIETLDRRDCLALLARAEVGRIAYALPAGAPGVVPVSYVLDGPDGEESVLVRTAHGSRLGRTAPGAAVAFEVDEIRPGTHEGWSVVAGGVAVLVTDPEELRRAAGRLQAWAPGFEDLFLRVPLETMSGRRLVSRERVVRLPDTPSPRWREDTGWTPARRTAAEHSSDFDGR